MNSRILRRGFALGRIAAVICLAGAIVVELVVVASPPRADAKAVPGAPGAGDRLFPGLGNGGYDAQSYDVSFDYQPGTTTMASSVTMRAEATQDLSRFTLDSVGQSISAVTVDGKPARFSSAGEKLEIIPVSPLRKGEHFTTTVTYTADRGNEPPSASFPDNGDPRLKIHNWINTPDGFALFGQPDRAHLFFPSNDHPSDKAMFTFRITVPRGLTAVANGQLAGKTDSGTRTTFTYRTAHPMATQVSQVAVGHFAAVDARTADGLPLRSLVPADQAQVARPFIDRTAGQIDWLSKTLGRPFPLENYGVLGLDSDYNGLALESQTLSTFSRNSMTRPENQESGTQLHELVHQYFGDAVSVGTWSDMWLSEGHAEFYSSFDRRPGQEGPIPPRGAYERDAKNRALHGPPAAPKRPTDVVMGTNEGGHLTLYALRQEIGAERFRQVEQTFFDRFRDRSATTQDYIDTVNQVTGRDLTGFLRDWLYGPATPPMPGHPDWKPAPPRGR